MTISSFPESTTKQGIPRSPALNRISPAERFSECRKDGFGQFAPALEAEKPQPAGQRRAYKVFKNVLASSK